MEIVNWIELAINPDAHFSHPRYNDFNKINSEIRTNMRTFLKYVFIEETEIFSIRNFGLDLRIKLFTNLEGFIFNHEIFVLRADLKNHTFRFMKGFSCDFIIDTKEKEESTIIFCAALFSQHIVNTKCVNSIIIDTEQGKGFFFNDKFIEKRNKFLELCGML